MKKITNLNLTVTIALLFGLVFAQGCGSSGSDPAPNTSDQVKAILTSGTWKINSVVVDGTDESGVYENLTLNFTSTAYSTTHGNAIWPASGEWSFSDTNGETIKRSDGLLITVTSAEASKLILRLNWNSTTIGPGRVLSVGGTNVFTFGK